jgi:hypothetical protein
MHVYIFYLSSKAECIELSRFVMHGGMLTLGYFFVRLGVIDYAFIFLQPGEAVVTCSDHNVLSEPG